MIDMTNFIAAKSDQLNADDLMDSPRTITITRVTAQADSADQPVSVHYEGGEGRPFKPCKTVRRIMVSVWGKDASKYAGRSMTLYRDPTVSFGGMQVGGIRVSHMSHIDGDKTVALLVTRGRKAPFKVKPLKMGAPATGANEAPTEETALAALTEAADKGMDALSNVWKQKWIAPFRDALQLDLDRLKVIAQAKKNTQPEAAARNMLDQIEDSPAQRIKDDLETAADAGDGEAVESIIAAAEARTDLTDEQRVTLEVAYSKARGRVGEKV